MYIYIYISLYNIILSDLFLAASRTSVGWRVLSATVLCCASTNDNNSSSSNSNTKQSNSTSSTSDSNSNTTGNRTTHIVMTITMHEGRASLRSFILSRSACCLSASRAASRHAAISLSLSIYIYIYIQYMYIYKYMYIHIYIYIYIHICIHIIIIILILYIYIYIHTCISVYLHV